MTAYWYEDLADKTKIPDDTTEFYCWSYNLNALPELPDKLEVLDSTWNNIKYLSLHNCQIVKNIELCILDNPVSEGFNSDSEFQESLE